MTSVPPATEAVGGAGETTSSTATTTSLPEVGELPIGGAIPIAVEPPDHPVAVTFHIAPNGDDTNGGTSIEDALATIQAGVDRAGPGDLVLVEPGTYAGSIEMSRSGEPDAWITVRSSEPQAAHVVIPAGWEYEVGFLVTGDYLVVDGFEVSHEENGPDQWGSGILIREAHHTWVVRNHVHDVGGAGIEFLQSDYSIAEGNTVHDTARWSPHQNSGINIYQARAFDESPGIHNILRGNVSYGNMNLVPTDDGTTDGNGIIIDDLRNDFAEEFEPYAFGTLVENNLVFGNGGKGILVFQSDDVVARNNTAFGNNFDSLNRTALRGELTAHRSSDVVWVNNIAVTAPDALPGNTGLVVAESDGVVVTANLLAGPSAGIDVSIESDRQLAYMGGNGIGLDPLFVNPTLDWETADFSLQAASPGLDAGTDIFGLSEVDLALSVRVFGGGVDIGAFERQVGVGATP